METLHICNWAAQFLSEKTKSSDNEAWSGDLVAAGPVYLQVGEG